MPRYAFLKEKPLLDRFKDDYKRPDYLRSAHVKKQWENPIIRRKRVKGIRSWVNSFMGRSHIHRLARLNAVHQASFKESFMGFPNITDNTKKILKYGSEKARLDTIEDVVADIAYAAAKSSQIFRKDPVTLKEVLWKAGDDFSGSKLNFDDNGWFIEQFLVNYKDEFQEIYPIAVKECGFKLDSDFEKTYNSDDKFPFVEWVISRVAKELYKYCDDITESANEKLGYEKGHKNSKGEDAPWVIRSHEDNRVLASFATKKAAEEHLKRMKQYSKKESNEAYVDNSDTAKKDYVARIVSALQDYYGYNYFKADDMVHRNYKKVMDWYMSGKVDAVEAARCLGGNCEPTMESAQNETRNYFGYAPTDILPPLDDKEQADFVFQVIYEWLQEHLPETLKDSADNYVMDVIDMNTRDYEQVKTMDDFYAFLDKYGPAVVDKATRSQDESKSVEGLALELLDTIRIPKWLWVAYQTDDINGLEDDELDKLQDFKEKYKDCHLDDRGDEAYFSSHNDFDNLGGNVYDVDVYKISDMPNEKKSESKNEALEDFPKDTNYMFTFGFYNPKTANIAKVAAEKNGYVAKPGVDNSVSIWTKEPQDAIRFADAVVNLANEDERVKLERSDVDKALIVAITKTTSDYALENDTYNSLATDYGVGLQAVNANHHGLGVFGELTDVVDFLEATK